MRVNEIIQGDCLAVLKEIPDNSVDCCITSPPYFGLRDYGVKGQIGHENTPEKYINKMIIVFREVRRTLRKEGTLWLNIGDTYWGGKGYSDSSSGTYQYQRRKEGKSITPECSNFGGKGPIRPTDRKHEYIKAKDLIGIPWEVALALRNDGWYLRDTIIWAKAYSDNDSNYGTCMPESVRDRTTKSFEYVFLLTRQHKYYYDIDAIKKPVRDSTILRLSQQIEKQKGSSRVPGKMNGSMKAVGPGRNPRKGVDIRGGNQAGKTGIPAMAIHGRGVTGHSGYFNAEGNIMGGGKANKRSVWTINPEPQKEIHFATYPQALIVDMIKAGCPENGIVLDPFMGSGTTAVVARKLNRNFIGIELNPKYIKLANKRLEQELGLFL